MVLPFVCSGKPIADYRTNPASSEPLRGLIEIVMEEKSRGGNENGEANEQCQCANANLHPRPYFFLRGNDHGAVRGRSSNDLGRQSRLSSKRMNGSRNFVSEKRGDLLA